MKKMKLLQGMILGGFLFLGLFLRATRKPAPAANK